MVIASVILAARDELIAPSAAAALDPWRPHSTCRLEMAIPAQTARGYRVASSSMMLNSSI